MLRILALQGSPKVNGANNLAVEEALRGAAAAGPVEIKKMCLQQLKITPCRSCECCSATGRCCIADDMTMIYEAIMSMDALVLSAPIYFSGINAQAKLAIDRCQPFWAAKYVLKQDLFAGKKRPGLFIATGGQKAYEGQFIGSQYVVDLLFKMIGVNSIGNIMLPDLDARPLAQRTDDLAQIYALGQKLQEV